jgi:hypothetical protein
MVHDLAKLQKEITRRRNQLQQMAAVTFPELKTFFKGSTAAPAARAVLEHFATPQHLAVAPTEHIAEVLRSAHAYSHAARAAELQAMAQTTSGVPTLTHHQWRQGWLIKQLALLEDARQDLVDQVAHATATHPYARIIESLPVKSRSGLRRSSAPLETSVGLPRSANSRPTSAGIRSSAARDHPLTAVSWPSAASVRHATSLGR